MIPLFDMLSQSQNGQGMELLARQFNLSQQQAALAVEALMPAFSQGLKQNASDPHGVAGFMNALASGRHAQYFENAQAAFSPQGVQEGNGILGHLFGSKDLSRAVASQAAQATGIGQDVLKQMMPVIASMIMGGLFKQSAGQMPQGSSASGSAGNPFGEIIEQMMRQRGMAGGVSPRQPSPQAGSPFDNPFGKVLEGMFGGGAAKPEPQGQPADTPFGNNPFGKIFEEMMGGGQRSQPEPDEVPKPRQKPRAPAEQKNPYDDIFGKMFETGAKQRDDYQKGVESIFEQFKSGMDRRR